MKRTTAYLALLLIFALLLSACGKQPPEATDPTAPSQQQNTQDTTPTIQPTDPPALTLEEEFQNLIKNNEWHKRALGCVFDKPENLPAYLYFYLGVGENGQFTAEESAFLKDAYEQTHTGGYEVMSDIKLPVTKINEALSILGITIEDIRIPDKWVYYDKTDSYYCWVTDAYGVGKWSVTKVEKDTDGKVTVYWETEDDIPIDADGFSTGALLRNPKMVLTMQQQPDGTYRILSNVPQKCATTEAKPKPHVLLAWTGEFSEENFRKTIESYQQNCTPFIFDEKNTTSSVTFETGFSISEAKIFRLTLVDDSNIAIEAEGWGRLVINIEFEHNDTEISVDIADWWHRFHENEEVNKGYIWSYIICAKDTAGAEHYFYFRVQYPTLQNDAES